MTVTVGPPQCYYCKHLHPWEHLPSNAPLTCNAFPEGIPDAFLEFARSHLKPYPGDHGILFEPSDPEEFRKANEAYGGVLTE